ncbi:MAG: tRNA (adenosine(37)-N6)-threonylcarbamoyltransferase complex ATPase subunit type 1 TsaE [Defluviitaleaceae bacterium]|nr:tRNA (adenosine(37)-N6)-threonylcarbamoyltransferase complex ATPase subunit type 1 TsaE [Defluviitaleaceae bacterium]
MIFESFSQADTEAFGRQIGLKATAGRVYCLIGQLGAGKTAFARGFARGLGITADITSPTFSIINEYTGQLPLYHFDVYRIKHVSEMEDTGYEEYFYGNGVTLVEWADMVEELWPPDAVIVRIERDSTNGEGFRRIIMEDRA